MLFGCADLVRSTIARVPCSGSGASSRDEEVVLIAAHPSGAFNAVLTLRHEKQ